MREVISREYSTKPRLSQQHQRWRLARDGVLGVLWWPSIIIPGPLRTQNTGHFRLYALSSPFNRSLPLAWSVPFILQPIFVCSPRELRGVGVSAICVLYIGWMILIELKRGGGCGWGGGPCHCLAELGCRIPASLYHHHHRPSQRRFRVPPSSTTAVSTVNLLDTNFGTFSPCVFLFFSCLLVFLPFSSTLKYFTTFTARVVSGSGHCYVRHPDPFVWSLIVRQLCVWKTCSILLNFRPPLFPS